MDMNEKLHSGVLYLPDDDDIINLQEKCLEKLYDFNMTRPREMEKRSAMLKDMFAEIGRSVISNLRFMQTGEDIMSISETVYANFNLTLVDDTHIYVGDCTMFAPNVTVATAGHPIAPCLRKYGIQYNAPVRIGKNCWIVRALSLCRV